MIHKTSPAITTQRSYDKRYAASQLFDNTSRYLPVKTVKTNKNVDIWHQFINNHISHYIAVSISCPTPTADC